MIFYAHFSKCGCLSVAYKASIAGFWAHYNIYIYIYIVVLTYLWHLWVQKVGGIFLAVLWSEVYAFPFLPLQIHLWSLVTIGQNDSVL